MRVADFTSSLYLGMRHAGAELATLLPESSALTSGRPAVLDPPAGAGAARRLALRAGAEQAAFTRSTLHGLNDCLEVLLGKDTALAVDSGVYPVGRWAVQRAAGTGTPVAWVGHHDVAGLESGLRRFTGRGLRPVVVADGLCTGCGRAYPVAEVVAFLDRYRATLLLDDTQALGILGVKSGQPYGSGGGGSVAHAGVSHSSVLAVSSLAKAFGAPVACVAGPARIVGKLRTAGSAVHSSPPSQVDIAAATHAVDRNAADGDRLRTALAHRVRMLRRVTARQDLTLVGGLFPVQSTPVIAVGAGRWLLDRLAANGVRGVLRQTCRGGSAVTLVVTAVHSFADVERAAGLLAGCWQELLDKGVRRVA
ncbi:hypothetical protein Rhe02_49870 [Rhizocola hellebori]|uniref:8-amino-7-oxononanoate synthase n=1 Tax=Rhizocola hellebori TaxID=1392758 RepID=A0A8J3QC77_9ACTN|nr:aminotransferase class I/II-fold pyridoxal phosphate-dependent enzyme [Rhizocola hellebori]GIH06920.1 hypothetical protein Rhe02_49870 [Rhizocola hellebori]